MPGGKIRAETNFDLLIAQGNASAADIVGPVLAGKTLDVLGFYRGEYEPDAAWCGWVNTSQDDMRRARPPWGPSPSPLRSR